MFKPLRKLSIRERIKRSVYNDPISVADRRTAFEKGWTDYKGKKKKG